MRDFVKVAGRICPRRFPPITVAAAVMMLAPMESFRENAAIARIFSSNMTV
jgi:hypothetical protein